MGFDITVLLTIVGLIGGLIAWVIVQVKDKFKSKIQLEQRIAAVELRLAVDAEKDSNITRSMNEILETLKELRTELKSVTDSVHQSNIDIAILKNKSG
ncbi:TPA: hypothetical protein N2299_001811 [Enterobacter hormaechei]|uniref:hypothetical protein n=1 Tax=Enterobacter cloacae complex TaxID=354276 RepID=UPI0005F03614|nr:MULTISPECIES: hypothetical protein [Enterobacter cloacae complex]KJO78510.1 hypothetical protein SR98_14080 [Enterobacter hormaechei subsp. xiangfangensis]KJP33683.1 hypothetical protein SR78_10175 [Enterobacter hormaechei subsp. xiangfangensis]MCY0805988.1 hypothetical protein [Enterobacter cloacae complex sp. 2022EL-00747]HCD7305135.1 hypothetical protein [Enterobacter hormaechei]HCL9444328.1 hypothetical protein [Enterobacter hormaechei]